MDSSKIGSVEAIAVIIILIISQIFINLPQNIIDLSGSASLINIIYISIIILGISFLFYKVSKLFPGQNIFDMAEFLAGKWLKYTLQIIYIGYLIFISALILRTFTLNLQIMYFSNLDIATILLVFLIASILLNSLGFRTVVKCALAFLPIILITLLVIFSSSLGEFETVNFQPILGNGASNTFIVGLSNIFSFSGIAILFLIVPQLKKQADLKKVILFSVGISAICLIFAVSCSMCLIPSTMSYRPTFCIYFMARRISLGSFLERLDPIFILVCILCIFSYLSICLAYTLKLFQKVAKTEHSAPLVYAFCSIIFIIALSILNVAEINYLVSVVYKYVSIAFVFVFCLLILILAAIKKKVFVKNSSKVPQN